MNGNIHLKNFPIALQAVQKIKNWPTYFSDLFGQIHKPYVIYTFRNGLKFRVRAQTADRGIVTTVALEDEYHIAKLQLPKNSTVIDIGAQAGIFTTFVSTYASRIYSYEPVRANFALLEKNVAINKLGKKVHTHNIAVADKKKKIKIYFSDSNTGGHSTFGEKDNYELVSTTTLSDILKKNKIERCDLLKMDVEGSEYDIFYATPKKDLEKIKVIRMEVHDMDDKKNNAASLCAFLRKNGFKVSNRYPLLFAYRP